MSIVVKQERNSARVLFVGLALTALAAGCSRQYPVGGGNDEPDASESEDGLGLDGQGPAQGGSDGGPPSEAPECTRGALDQTSGDCVEATKIVAGDKHTCALLSNGNVRCWGNGKDGQLGYGNTNSVGDDETPASVGDVPVGGRVQQLAAGGGHTCALLADGSVRCWGNGTSGQLGYGNTFNIGDDETPASAGAVNVGGKVVQIAAGAEHTCALIEGGQVRCWGKGGSGRLGYGNTFNIGDDETPASAGDVNVGSPVSQIATGGGHTCVITAGNTVKCWGDGKTAGQTGYFSPTNFSGHVGETLSCETILAGKFIAENDALFDVGDNEAPATVGRVSTEGSVVEVATGDLHTCLLTADGSTKCWGYTASGQIGYPPPVLTQGNVECSVCPGSVAVGAKATKIAAGKRHTCALVEGGKVRCWGLNELGQSGIAGKEIVLVPTEVNVGGLVGSLAVGGEHTCALLVDGAIRCWGLADDGQLGYRGIEKSGPRGTRFYSVGRDEAPATQATVRYLD